MRANIFIAESCIIYLLQFDSLQTRLETYSVAHVCNEYPLAKYAATSWYIHSQRAEEGGNIIPLSRSFLVSKGYAPVIAFELRSLLAHGGRLLGQGKHHWLDARCRLLPLHVALRFNLPKLAKALIMEGADVTLRRRDGWTPLMEVRTRPHTHSELLQFLLDNGAEVNARNDDGWTALMGPAYSELVQILRILLDYGADIDLRTRKKWYTTLTLAAMIGSSVLVAQLLVNHLLDSGVSISSSEAVEVLQIVSCACNNEILHMLLGRGVDELHDTVGVLKYIKFETALLIALASGKVGVLDLLLAYGADVNARSKIGGTPGVGLKYTLSHGEDNMLEFLLEHGADPRLIRREYLNEDGTRRYEEMVSRFERSLRSRRRDRGATG